MDIIKWINIKEESPLHKEIVIAASHNIMAVCVAFVHGNCSEGCKHMPDEISFYSQEVEGRTLKNVTHFARIRNPNETLQ